MDLNNVRRVSSAGYRLPQRSNGSRPGSAQPPADRTRHAQREAADVEQQNPDKSDPVKQDRVWKELMRSERRGIREWWVGPQEMKSWIQVEVKVGSAAQQIQPNQCIMVHREKNWSFLKNYDQMVRKILCTHVVLLLCYFQLEYLVSCHFSYVALCILYCFVSLITQDMLISLFVKTRMTSNSEHWNLSQWHITLYKCF